MKTKMYMNKSIALAIIFVMFASIVATNQAYALDNGLTLTVNDGNNGTYATLTSAINAATTGDTILLARDVNESIIINKNISFDGDLHTLTGNIIADSSFTCRDLTLIATGAGIYSNTASVNIQLDNCNISSTGQFCAGVRIDGGNSTLVVSGGEISSGFGVYFRNAENTIQLINTSITGIGANGWGGTAVICENGSGSLEVTDSTLEGSNAAIMASGYTVTTTNSTLLPVQNQSGGEGGNQQILIDTGEKLVTALGGTEFAETTLANEIYEVTLKKNIELTNNGFKLNIPKLVLIGGGFSINSTSNNYPGIEINSGEVTINDFTTNMEIAVSGTGTIVKLDSTHVMNEKISIGGVAAGIYISGNSAKVDVTDSVILGQGNLSTGIRIDGGDVELTVKNSEVIGAFGIYVNNAWGDVQGSPSVTVSNNSIIKSYQQMDSYNGTTQSWGGQGIRVDGNHSVINFESGKIMGIDNPSGTVSDAFFGIYVQGTNATVNISGGEITGKVGTITANDQLRLFGGDAMILEGQGATINMTGGKLNGTSGIDIRGGGPHINISGTSEITGESFSTFSGIFGGRGISIEDGQNALVNISSGSVSGDYGIYLRGNHAAVNVSGGSVTGIQKELEGLVLGGYGIYVYGSNSETTVSGGTVTGSLSGVLVESRSNRQVQMGVSRLSLKIAYRRLGIMSNPNIIALEMVDEPSSVTRIKGTPTMNPLGACFGDTDGQMLIGINEQAIYKSDISLPTASITSGVVTFSGTTSGDQVRFSQGDTFDYETSTLYTVPFLLNEDSDVYVAVTRNVQDYKVTNISKITIQEVAPVETNPGSGTGNSSESISSSPISNKPLESNFTKEVNTINAVGEKLSTLTLKQDSIQEIQQNGEITFETDDNTSDVVIGQMNAIELNQLINKGATINIKTATTTYSVPANGLDVEKMFGEKVMPSEIILSVKVRNASKKEAEFVETATKGLELLVPAIEFGVTVEYNGITKEISKFDGYVERTILIPEGIDTNKITTAVVVEADGTLRTVPTKNITKDGKTYAVINSLTNSMYTVIYNHIKVNDIAGTWAEKSIQNLFDRLIFTSSQSAIYEPTKGITRSEYTIALVKALGLKISSEKTLFTDISEYDSYIQTAVEIGLVKGYNNSMFQPNSMITREESMVLLNRAMGIVGIHKTANISKLSGFYDAKAISKWAEEDVVCCIDALLVNGTSSKLLEPKRILTKAEAAVIIERLLKTSGLI